MPSVWLGRDLPSIIARHERILRQMGSQQQSVISNLDGVPVIATVRIPGSNPSSYGYQFLDPTSHVPIMFFGEDGTHGAGVLFFDINGNLVRKQDNSGDAWYNAAGHVIRVDNATGSSFYDGSASQILQSKIDGSGTHYYDTSGNEIARVDGTGLHVYNSSGTQEVAAGLLNSSPAIYGLGVLPYGGSELQMVGGWLSVSAPAANNVTNTTWSDFGSPSSITLEVGPSGQAVVAVQSSLSTGTGGEQAIVGVSVDGGTPYGFLELVSGAGGVSGTIGSQYTWTGLSAGSHTFQLAYKTASNGSSTCSFSNAQMTITPQ